ncbi:2-C-methyl-D-erythritol 4-phosphate cytidylyltransferase [Vibrio maerlii]|uniref:2-C-methyl-D-erythritol 4-phosphate cytidylyltransferase n=1 Tax=Vibrio maerlii TaxID=2231648 RepID=UPI000E3EDB51|nr:2-C-methyl-D-erythritol 4-phosphate cytidylyltransferase [Vibrio maerlii]
MPLPIVAVVPAAGVGSRMKADRPKQYLPLHGKAVLEHTIEKLLEHPRVERVVVSISKDDPYFPELEIATNPKVTRVAGGKERADSVLSGLQYLAQETPSALALVHDAARPCITTDDITKLIESVELNKIGAILAAPVRDTMKRSAPSGGIEHTVERVNLWHALTPQLFEATELAMVLRQALEQQVVITDEASAFEWAGKPVNIVTGRADNLKITQPEDLALAEYYLAKAH